MNQYKSIEEMFPEWKEARQVIEANILNQFKFIFDPVNPTKVIVDYRFIVNIWNLAWEAEHLIPGKEYMPYSFRVELIRNDILNSLAKVWEDIDLELNQMLFRVRNQATLAAMNEILYRNDMTRQVERKATTIDIVKHYFGVQPCYLDFD